MRCSTAIVRPGFHPLSIGLMVLGFLIAWPLGLAMLAWMLWGDRLGAFVSGVREGLFRSGAARGFADRMGPGFGFSTGNSAFDDYRAAELARLEAERARLEDEAREFAEWLRHLRRARDRDEFDRFRAERTARRAWPGDRA